MKCIVVVSEVDDRVRVPRVVVQSYPVEGRPAVGHAAGYSVRSASVYGWHRAGDIRVRNAWGKKNKVFRKFTEPVTRQNRHRRLLTIPEIGCGRVQERETQLGRIVKKKKKTETNHVSRFRSFSNKRNIEYFIAWKLIKKMSITQLIEKTLKNHCIFSLNFRGYSLERLNCI